MQVSLFKLKIFFLHINFLVLFFFSPIPLRGIVEGFYGTPWTFENRVDLIKFCRNHNLNSYIYAPKNDPYHRDKWRVPYPDEKIQEFKNLILLANINKVRFIFAVSPGLDLNFIGEKANEDFNILLTKIDSLYKIGCKEFAIFFDDIIADINSGKNHAKFLNKLQKALNVKYSDINPIITIPTEFYTNSMIDKDGNIKQYTEDFSHILNKKIIVLYTGDRVVSDGIPLESFKKTLNIYKKDLGIWWNYPVNDYLKNKLALGPIEKLPTSNIKSIFFNPMRQIQLSKIAIATGAKYSLSPKTYNANNSWNKAIEEQFKELAPAMKIFAIHSRHFENSWAFIGPDDGPEFYAETHQVILDTKSKKKVDFSKLLSLINKMEKSANILLQYLPIEILAECKLQLEQFKRIINADKIAVKSLQNLKLDNELKSLRSEIFKHENEALISEKSAVKFIDEVLNLFE